MRKFITSKFEINLSAYNISVVEENHWFSDQFFTKYSFPFELEITDELNEVLGDILNDNSSNIQTFLEGKYVDGDLIEDATLEIEESVNELASVVIRYGLEELPSFSKKLSELPLLQLDVDNIYTHAPTIVNKTYPEVVYNFPQIYTEKIKTGAEGEEGWEDFDRKINNYENGAFLENYVDLQTNKPVNINIIQPLPYVLYIFKKGFESAGFNLVGGSVLDNEYFKKMLLFADTDYFKEFPSESLPVKINSDEYYSLSEPLYLETPDPVLGVYRDFSVKKFIPITKKGRYRITGKLYFRNISYRFYHGFGIQHNWTRNTPPFVLYDVLDSEISEGATSLGYNVEIDLIFTTPLDSIDNSIYFWMDGVYTPDTLVFDLEITPLFYYDVNNQPINILNQLSDIDLTKAVPDMTFGDFLKAFKNWYNLDFNLEGNNVYMNFIEDNINYKNAFDLSKTEILRPQNKYHIGKSFVLKFQDIEDERFSYKQVFQSKDEVKYSEISKDDKTEEITVQALPLPNYQLNENGVTTSFAFEQGESRVFVVLYSGLNQDTLNLTEDPTPLFLENVHRLHWQKWFDFRINARSKTWNFKAYREDIIGLTAKSKIFAYGRIMIVKSLTLDEVKPDLYDVEIEAHTLK